MEQSTYALRGGVPFKPFLGFDGLFAVGDSKTNGDSWVSELLISLLAARSNSIIEMPSRFGIDGATVATMKTYIDANLDATSGKPIFVCINLGANDVTALPAEATWKSNCISIIDSILARWSGVNVYIARPWRRDYGAECNTLKSWIGDVVVGYSSGVNLGPDETVWLENGDNGATYTLDGVHYNAAGETECAAQWLTAMGY